MVGRRSHRIPVLVNSDPGPAVAVQSIDKLTHESSRMTGLQQLVEARRQHPYLLPVHWTMRHYQLPPNDGVTPAEDTHTPHSTHDL